MASPAQLVAELRRHGYEVSERQLRDWRRKGLLPLLDCRSQGRGLGVVRYWKNSERVVAQAMAVCDFLDGNGRVKWALLGLWCAGYEVNLETVRLLWLQSLDRTRKEWLGNALSKVECEDALGDWSRRLAKRLRHEAWARELDLDQGKLEPLLHEILNVCFNPAPEIAIDDDVADAARSILLRNTTARSELMDRDHLESWLTFVQANLSNDAMRTLISEATSDELRVAHNRWCSVLEIIRLLSSHACGGEAWGDLTQIGRKAAIPFGGLCLFGLLLADRNGKGQWVDSHIEEARNHIFATMRVMLE